MNNAENTTAPLLTPELVRAVLACLPDGELEPAEESNGYAPCAVDAVNAAESVGAPWHRVLLAVDNWLEGEVVPPADISEALRFAAFRGIAASVRDGRIDASELEHAPSAILAELGRRTGARASEATQASETLALARVSAAGAAVHGEARAWANVRDGVAWLAVHVVNIGGDELAQSLVDAIRSSAAYAMRSEVAAA